MNNLLSYKGLIFIFILLTGLVLPAFTLSAQETMVVGQVVNAADRSPIPFVNISFKNTNIFVQSNNDGYFVIKTAGKQTTLVFSCVGFKRLEIKIRHGQSVGIDVPLEEESTMLQEAFVIPGINPAVELMRKVRSLAKLNDVTRKPGYSAQSTEQNLVLLSKVNQRTLSKRIFDQLKTGNLSKSDSSLVLPLYMAESKHIFKTGQKKETEKNIYSSTEDWTKLLDSFVGHLETELNFYDNAVSIYGKSIISPLSASGFSYYYYYLTDSLHTQEGKQYEVHFYSKNKKNLAFDGKLWIDSATLALTKIEAELPNKANINLIHNLRISEKFNQQPDKSWTRQSENMALNMNYQLMLDSLHGNPELFLKRRANYLFTDSTSSGNFAQSVYSTENLNDKLKDLNSTPLFRTARWIADVVFTGYMQVGKIDIGKIQQLARITDVEGFRMTLPLRTNERLWKNVSVGGYLGYGTKNQALKYSGMAQFRLPGVKKRVIAFNYTDDYRRIDFNYNDFMYRENPLTSGDEDITTTLLALWSADKLNERKEFNITFSNDWNSDIESCLYLRSNEMIANRVLPMVINGNSLNSLSVRSATLSTRFSFGEKSYEDHLQRIYIPNKNPVLYLIFEGGQYDLKNISGQYSKMILLFKHTRRLDIGTLDYTAEGACIFGKVPYPLLQIPSGTESGGYGLFQVKVPSQLGNGSYSMYQFNMMKYMEYGADRYVSLHSELTLNGLLMNQIPIIKGLNLRELFSFKMAYGTLKNSNQDLLDYPGFMQGFKKPYMELGVGITNILHVFSIQSVWRLTDIDNQGVFPWGIRAGISINF
jgi:hypothetical protein